MISNMEFDCKLAHQDDVKRVSNFNSIRELYERISKSFSVPVDEILYCTLNTHEFRDMNALLGNYLSLGDLIVVHLCGLSRELTISKTHQYLGLTITDNGNGRAFVKKVNEDYEVIAKLIKPGDHIAAINLESTIGMRHYEVARTLREVPQNTSFRIVLIEPIHSNRPDKHNRNMDSTLNLGRIDLNGSDRSNLSLMNGTDCNTTITRFDVLNLNDQSIDDLTKSSLPLDRLLSKETAGSVAQIKTGIDNHDAYRRTIEHINSILESFMGINDNILAIKIYRMAHENRDSYDRFIEAINDSELAIFNFDQDIKHNFWRSATRAM